MKLRTTTSNSNPSDDNTVSRGDADKLLNRRQIRILQQTCREIIERVCGDKDDEEDEDEDDGNTIAAETPIRFPLPGVRQFSTSNVTLMQGKLGKTDVVEDDEEDDADYEKLGIGKQTTG